MFTGISSWTSLLIKDEDGHYKVQWEEIFNFYVETDKELDSILLSNPSINFFVIKERNSYKVFDKQKSISQEQLKGVWAVVHNDNGENGLLLIETPEVILPNNIHDGFYISQQENPLEGIIISRNGMLLKGPVYLDGITGELNLLSKEELSKLFVDGIGDKIEVPFSGFVNLDGYYEFYFTRSVCHKVGDKTFYVVQDVTRDIIATGPHNRLIKTLDSETRTILKKIDKEVTQINSEASSILRKELSGLFTLVYFIEEAYSHSGFGDEVRSIFTTNMEEMFWFSVRGDDIINNLFRFHGYSSSRLYTVDYVLDIIHVLNPTSNDLLNINPVSSPNAKVYYDTFLKLITNKISHPHFVEFQDILYDNGQPRTFSSGNYLIASDFSLIQDLEQVLSEIFSFAGNVLISMGILNFEKRSSVYSFDFEKVSKIKLSQIFNKFGFTFRIGTTNILKPNVLYQPHISIEDVFISSIVLGYTRNFQIGSSIQSFNMFPSDQSLIALFENYKLGPQTQSYYSRRVKEIVDLYDTHVNAFEESMAMDFIFEYVHGQQSLSVDDFLTFFKTRLSALPFGVYNERTVSYMIEYYNLNWVVERGIIINNDYTFNKFNDYDLGKVLNTLREMFRVGAFYEEEFLLKTLSIDSWSLSNIISAFGGYTHNTIGPVIRFDASKSIYFDLKKNRWSMNWI